MQTGPGPRFSSGEAKVPRAERRHASAMTDFMLADGSRGEY